MKNEYCGNTLICKKCDNHFQTIKNPFDAIMMKSEHDEIVFDIALFLNGDIRENNDVCFFLIIRPLDEQKEEMYMPLVSQNISVKIEEPFLQASRIKPGPVRFPDEGMYALELRYVEEKVTNNQKKLYDAIEHSQLIKRFAFMVRFEQNNS